MTVRPSTHEERGPVVLVSVSPLFEAAVCMHNWALNDNQGVENLHPSLQKEWPYFQTCFSIAIPECLTYPEVSNIISYEQTHNYLIDMPVEKFQRSFLATASTVTSVVEDLRTRPAFVKGRFQLFLAGVMDSPFLKDWVKLVSSLESMPFVPEAMVEKMKKNHPQAVRLYFHPSRFVSYPQELVSSSDEVHYVYPMG